MLDLSGIDLDTHTQAQWARRRPVVVDAEFAASAGTLDTLEGPVRYAAGDALVRGTSGERWPVDRESFVALYEPAPGTREGSAGRYRKRALRVRALRVGEVFGIDTAGGRLSGQAGDWVVQYSRGHFGVVRADIFQGTYEPDM